MAIVDLCLYAVAFASCISVISANAYCTSITSRTSSMMWCKNGCCGSYPYQRCCGVRVGEVVGAVMGGVVFLCFLVSLCCFCARRRRHATDELQDQSGFGAKAYPGNVSVVPTNAQLNIAQVQYSTRAPMSLHPDTPLPAASMQDTPHNTK